MIGQFVHILELVRDNPGKTKRELAQISGYSPRTFDGPMSFLRRGGWVSGGIPPNRIRSYTFTITDKGLAELESRNLSSDGAPSGMNGAIE